MKRLIITSAWLVLAVSVITCAFEARGDVYKTGSLQQVCQGSSCQMVTSQGTAFSVGTNPRNGNRVLASVGHGIVGASEVWIDHGGTRYIAKVIEARDNQRQDYSILEVSSKLPCEYDFTLIDAKRVEGHRVRVIGFPGGRKSYQDGVLVRNNAIEWEHKVQCQSFASGYSGSPACVRQNGQYYASGVVWGSNGSLASACELRERIQTIIGDVQQTRQDVAQIKEDVGVIRERVEHTEELAERIRSLVETESVQRQQAQIDSIKAELAAHRAKVDQALDVIIQQGGGGASSVTNVVADPFADLEPPKTVSNDDVRELAQKAYDQSLRNKVILSEMRAEGQAALDDIKRSIEGLK